MVFVSKASRSSYSARFAVAHGGIGVERREAPLEPGLGFVPQMIVERHARGRRELGQVVLAERQGEIAALRDRDAFASASGRSANAAAISACVRKYCSGVKRSGRRGSAQHVALGDADARLVRAKVATAQELHRVRRHDRAAPSSPREIDGRGDERVVVGVAGALHLEVVATGEPRGPFARGLGRAARDCPGAALPDVAVARAGERDQAVGPFVEPLAASSARPRCWLPR